MFPGLNPRKMNSVMKQLGISQEEIPATKVIIEKEGNTEKIIIQNPSVTKIKMRGQETFQITGKIKEEFIQQDIVISEEDIKTVMGKTNVTYEQAKKTLEKTGDLAETILELSKK